jgi:TPR repeat protein
MSNRSISRESSSSHLNFDASPIDRNLSTKSNSALISPASSGNLHPGRINSTNSIAQLTSEEDNSHKLIIEELKTLAVRITTEGHENKKLQTIKGSDELLRRIGEVLNEVEEQYTKILITMKTSKSVMENLLLLKDAMKDIQDFYTVVKLSWMVLTKSKLKLRMQNHYQTLRSRCTQLLTAVSLELLTDKPVFTEETPVASSELYRQGLNYFYGLCGKPKNYIWAFEKFVHGSELGDSECMIMTGKCYLHGYGIEANSSIGLKWFEKAANLGSICPHAKTEIALQIIEKLKATDKDSIKTYFHYSPRLVSLTSSTKQTSNVFRHSNSLTSPPDEDDEEGSRTSNTAATLTEDEMILEDEEYLIHHDIQYAMKLLLEAASEGHIESKTYLGTMYEEIEDYESAAKWYSIASNNGCSLGTFHLAQLLFFAKTNSIGTRQKAFSLYSIAAKNGQNEAFNGLGLCYEAGIGIEGNLSFALLHYRLGAKGGSSQAMYNLGYLLIKNAIDVIDNAKLRKKKVVPSTISTDFFSSSSLLPSSPSRDGREEGNVDHELLIDIGIPVDEALQEGIHWLRAAAENQVSDAAFQLGRLYEQVSILFSSNQFPSSSFFPCFSLPSFSKLVFLLMNQQLYQIIYLQQN